MGVCPGWWQSHDQVDAQMVTVYLNFDSWDGISVRFVLPSRFKIIENFVILSISFVFLMLMAVGSKFYSSAES